jgi:hypothetical protein
VNLCELSGWLWRAQWVKGRLELRRAKLVAYMFEHKARPSVVSQGSGLI